MAKPKDSKDNDVWKIIDDAMQDVLDLQSTKSKLMNKAEAIVIAMTQPDENGDDVTSGIIDGDMISAGMLFHHIAMENPVANRTLLRSMLLEGYHFRDLTVAESLLEVADEMVLLANELTSKESSDQQGFICGISVPDGDEGNSKIVCRYYASDTQIARFIATMYAANPDLKKQVELLQDHADDFIEQSQNVDQIKFN